MDFEEGKGTTFRIFLPRHHPEQEVQHEPQATNGAIKDAAAAPKPKADLTRQGNNPSGGRRRGPGDRSMRAVCVRAAIR